MLCNTGILTFTVGHLGHFSNVSPISRHGVFGFWIALKPTDVEVEHSEFVFAQDVAVGLRSNAAPDVSHCSLEKVVDGRIEFAFGIASDVDCTLVVECTYSVNIGLVIATHGFFVV